MVAVLVLTNISAIALALALSENDFWLLYKSFIKESIIFGLFIISLYWSLYQLDRI